MMLPFLTTDDVDRAIPTVRAHLSAGKLLAYPTETVYGLGSAPTEAALDALARLKGRPPRKPFLLLVSSEKMPEAWGLVYSRAASALAAAFWPGPLTLILKGGEGRLPDRLRGAEGGHRRAVYIASRDSSFDRGLPDPAHLHICQSPRQSASRGGRRDRATLRRGRTSR